MLVAVGTVGLGLVGRKQFFHEHKVYIGFDDAMVWLSQSQELY